MFADLLKRLTAPAPETLPDTDARLALTALLVRVARSDGDYDHDERARIDRIARARANTAKIDRIYPISGLGRLEADVAARFGGEISVTKTYVNAGPMAREESRWPKLLNRMATDKGRAALEAFAEADLELMAQLGLLEA